MALKINNQTNDISTDDTAKPLQSQGLPLVRGDGISRIEVVTVYPETEDPDTLYVLVEA